ncbi:MAG: hypothetical protein H2B00_03075 [Nitrosopumilaceae archaeon]|uniref:Uncharacterized protein n=2 Tax=Candidatus Nitrosomaritimum aestuariumsis TaxID=3342354 RepID=A0AC60VW50_9ARCH|nr:hypothetical protein [Nitrosopumilaceae archaeon]MBA4460299.1 hypothetical protein [Nitrosopumilaceae archaeon]MBA4461478.1 hypothetical protein [Nitrosopumilaceae archaeon]MBA4463075.1 hypothetical protein [Nitrosopumilaceae archaeon]
MNYQLIVLLLIIPGFFGVAFAHTVDSVGEYRLEIGWMNEPVVSGETNGIELFVSPLEPELPLEEQEFKNGIAGLHKFLKMQLILKDEKITLPLSPDHNIPGKYYAYVNPTVAGFYQANILGNIGNTTVSLSMHPPKVDERGYIEFPESSDLTLNQLIDGHTAVVGEVNDLKETVSKLEQLDSGNEISYAGIGLGIIAIIIAGISLARSKK